MFKTRVKGRYTVTHLKATGEVLAQYTFDNLITNAGLDWICAMETLTPPLPPCRKKFGAQPRMPLTAT